MDRRTVWQSLAETAPRLVLLLTVSPLIGALVVVLVGRRGVTAARQAALGNCALTCVLAVIVFATTSARLAESGSAAPVIGTRIPWFQLSTSTMSAKTSERASNAVVGASSRAEWLVASFSVGVDRLNAGPLLWIAFLGWSGLLLSRGTAARSASYCCLWLLLEASFLIAFAAQDALTFVLSTEACVWLSWLMAGWHGGAERRSAAGKYVRLHATAQTLLLIGLMLLAVAAAWCRQELTTAIPALQFDWQTLTGETPRIVRRYVSSLQYWDLLSWGLCLLLVVSAALRSPLVPCHAWWPAWLAELPGAFAPLSLAAGNLVGGLIWLRVIVPVFPETRAALSPILADVACFTTIYASLLALAHSDVRRFTAYWFLALQGMAWLALTGPGPAAIHGGWWLMQSAALTGASWMSVVHLLEDRYGSRTRHALMDAGKPLPRLKAVGVGIILVSVGFPAIARGPGDLLFSTAVGHWGPFGWGWCVLGLLLTSWAALWMMTRIFWGASAGTLEEIGVGHPTSVVDSVLREDLTLIELFALSPPLVFLLGMNVWPSAFSGGP